MTDDVVVCGDGRPSLEKDKEKDVVQGPFREELLEPTQRSGWEARGDSVDRRVRCGKVKVKYGLKTKARASGEDNVCNEVLHVIGLYGPGDKVSLFLKEWELARVALSCHIAQGMLCHEMHAAW